MKISITLKTTQQPIDIMDAKNTYTKGGLYCIYLNDGTVKKIPLSNILFVDLTVNEDFKSKDGSMKVSVRLLDFSQPIVFKKVLNSISNNSFYSILLKDGTIRSFPLVSIFDINESY